MIVEDHPLMRDGIIARIGREPGISVCGEVDSATSALKLMETVEPDVVLVDIGLKEGNGIDLIRRALARRPGAKMLVLSAHAESVCGEPALLVGARGYLSKQQASAHLIEAIRAVASGLHYFGEPLRQRLNMRAVGANTGRPVEVRDLSNRELEVFQLIGEGNGTNEIAGRLNLSVHTVETYREHIRDKLSLKNGTELMQRAVVWYVYNH